MSKPFNTIHYKMTDAHRGHTYTKPDWNSCTWTTIRNSINLMNIHRNRLWDPCDASPPTFGDQVYFVPSNFCNFLLFFAWHCGKPNLRARRKENGWNRTGAITGYCDGIGRKILRGSIIGILQLLSRDCSYDIHDNLHWVKLYHP